MATLPWRLLVLGVLVSLLPVPALEAQEADYVRADNITQIVERWVSERHLYVLGALPQTSEAELRQLAGWLKGKHWYVVLARNADGQLYTDIQGGRHAGVEAMDYALGRGIGLKEGFEALKHPKTGEKDGAVFGLNVDNRKLFLHTSDAHDRRGLWGKQHFAGDLDQWAKNAMRNQGPHGVITAVKDTVINVDARLEQKIAQEMQASRSAVDGAATQLAELERRAAVFRQAHPSQSELLAAVDVRALQAQLKSSQALLDTPRHSQAAEPSNTVRRQAASAVAAIDAYEKDHGHAEVALRTAGAHLNELASAAQRLQREHPGLSGDLARIDLAALESDLKGAQSELEAVPGQAQTRAEKLNQRITTLQDGLARYETAGTLLTQEQARLAALEARPGAAIAQDAVLNARQALAEAVKAHGQGDSTYVTLMSRTAPALDSAERAIAHAEVAAARGRLVLTLLSLLVAAAVVVTALVMYLSARRHRARAQKLLADWRGALATKLDLLQGDFDRNYRTWIANYRGKSSGATQRLVEEARESRGWVAIIWALAQDRLAQVRALVEPGILGRTCGLVWAAPYKRALGFENEKVTFRPDDEELLRKLFGKERTWEDQLLGSLQDYVALTASFAELVQQLNLHTQKVQTAIKTIETSALGLEPRLQRTEAESADLEAKKGAVEQAAAAELFRAPSLFTALVPAARAQVDAARVKGKPDPVGAYQGEARDAERMMDEGQRLAGLLVRSGTGVRSAIAQAVQTLQGQGIGTPWIEAELAKLSKDAEAIAAAAVTESVGERTTRLEVGLATLGERAARAQALTEERDRIIQRMARAHEEVVAARKEISERTGVAPEQLLNEKGWKVDNKLYHAQKRVEQAAQLIGAADLDSADTQLEQARRFGKQVAQVLDISLAAAREYRRAVAALSTDAQRLGVLVPERDAKLAQLRTAYAPSVLDLGPADEARPQARRTLANNISEANQQLQQAADRMRNAEVAFQAGRVLETAELLNQAKAYHDLAQQRLDQLKETQTRLQEAEHANRIQVAGLQTTLPAYRHEIETDARTMKPTLAALEQAAGTLAAAVSAVEAKKGDPFAARTQLEAAAAALAHVHGSLAPNDRDLFALAESSLKGADRQMVPLEQLVLEAKQNKIPHSEALSRAAREAGRLASQLKQAHERLHERHGDWNALHAEASRITTTAGQLIALVQGEIEKAEAAVAQIEQAARRVSQAGTWAGAYGIRIPGAPGDALLDQARVALARGRYSEAQAQADSAYRAAQQAIEAAEAAVAAEAARLRRIEEEQRAQQQAQAAATVWTSATSSDNCSTSWGGGFGGTSGGGIFDAGGGASSFGGFTDSGGGSSGW
jgi:hypothetical protein